MHVVGMVRGYWRDMMEWFQDVSMIHLPYKYKDPKTKKTRIKFIRVAVRPWIPIEIVFPKESLKTVLGMIKPRGSGDYMTDRSKKNKMAFNMIRKSLGLKKLPDEWKEHKHLITNILKNHAVGVHLFGMKDDLEGKEGEAL